MSSSPGDLLEEACHAHGGLERWRRAAALRVHIRSGGFALKSRWQGSAFADYHARISTLEPRLEVEPFGAPGHTGFFKGGGVLIKDTAGAIIASRPAARAAFQGLRRNLWWDACDVLFFGGYAIWNYFSLPFLLTQPGFKLSLLDPWNEAGETWRRLRARFPATLPTHSTVQDFYFGPEGKLRRHDYTAEVFGAWATAANYSTDYFEASGLSFAARRRVYPRKTDNTPRPWPNLVWIDTLSVEVLDA